MPGLPAVVAGGLVGRQVARGRAAQVAQLATAQADGLRQVLQRVVIDAAALRPAAMWGNTSSGMLHKP